ncbi:hypothetical protein KSD_50240 [Ktedonobacter sp. SOSP1-85]|uniref:DUF4386 domain-containing protein n=1 Tax=Ktedonobacter sp. SOSP1-85 TaxID=2778367 RepID=UPI0019166E8D|nr:DUF4386 domain-containing protein [Ktedonobacter sp. SOSP1-85]GHO77253.1 hypothetical protein KSD_50240 [Ktedonobacter sp. SOSP1-85]
MTQTTGKTTRAGPLQADREAFQVASADSMNAPKRTKRIVSASQRKAEILIATLFLVSAVTSFLGMFLLDPILNASDYLARVFPNKGAVELGSLLWSINNIGIVFIAVFAFGVLRKRDEVLAVGYLTSRIIEGTIMMLGIVATLLLIPLSQGFLQAGAPHGSWFLTLGDVLKHTKYLGLTQLSLPMLGLGGCLFTWMLFRYRLVPRFISVVGLIGYALMFLSSIVGWFNLVDLTPSASGWDVLVLPVAAFEIILLPFWLLFRGFKTPDAPEHPVAE